MREPNTISDIEIFDRKTGEVIKRTRAGLRSFMVYWNSQCNDDDFGYRVVGVAE